MRQGLETKEKSASGAGEDSRKARLNASERTRTRTRTRPHLRVEPVVERLCLPQHLRHAIALLRVSQQLGQQAVALGVQRL